MQIKMLFQTAMQQQSVTNEISIVVFTFLDVFASRKRLQRDIVFLV